MAYAIKTKEELQSVGLWNYKNNAPIGFPSDGSKNHLIGTVLPNELYEKCESGKNFTYNKVKLTPKHIKKLYVQYRLMTEKELSLLKNAKDFYGYVYAEGLEHFKKLDGRNHKFLGSSLPKRYNDQVNNGAEFIKIFNMIIPTKYLVPLEHPVYRYKTIREIVVDGGKFILDKSSTNDNKIESKKIIQYKGIDINLDEYAVVEGRRPHTLEHIIDEIVSTKNDKFPLVTCESTFNDLNAPLNNGDILKNFFTNKVFRGIFIGSEVYDVDNKKWHNKYAIIPPNHDEISLMIEKIQKSVPSVPESNFSAICIRNFVFNMYSETPYIFTKDVIYPCINTSDGIEVFSDTGSFKFLKCEFETYFEEYEEIEDIFNFKF